MDDREKQQLPPEGQALPNNELRPTEMPHAAPAEVEPPTQHYFANPEPNPMPVAPVQENQPFEPMPMAPKPKRKGMIIAIVVAAALAVLGGGSALAYNFWYQNPDKVVGDALMNALKAQSVAYEGTVDVSEDGRKASVVFDGKGSEGANAVNAKIAVTMDGKSISLGGGLFVDAKGTLYFKVNGVKAAVKDFRGQIPPASQAIFDKVVAKVDNQWIGLKASDTEEFSAGYAKTQKCLAESARRLREDNAVMTEVTDIYKEHPFIAVEKSLGSKNGSLGYALHTDNAKAKDFTKAMKATAFYKDLHKCDPSISLDEPTETKEDSKAKTTTELWVSRWSHEVTKVTVDASEGGMKTSLVLEPRFNEKMELKAPQSSVTMEQLKADITALIQSMMMPAVTPPAQYDQTTGSSSDLFS